MNDERKGVLLTILTSLSLGLNVIFGQLLVNIVNVETSNTIWFMFASVIFIIFFASTRRLKSFKKTLMERKKEILAIGILSAAGSIFWMYGILYAGTNNLAFVFQFNVIFTVILGTVFLKERFKKIEILGFALAILGILILAYDNNEIGVISILVILVSALFNSISNFASKVFVRRINPTMMAGGRAIFIFLLTLLYATATNSIQTNIPNAVFFFAFLGGLSGAFIGFIFFFKALEKIKVSKAMTIRTMEPFLVVIFSFIILSIIPTKNQLIGGPFIMLGIIILSLSRGG